MSGLTGNNILAGASGQSTGYDIDQSLRVDDGDSANLSRTPSSASNRKTWTWSGWVKRGNLATGSNQCFFSAGADGSNFQNLAFNTSDALFFDHYESNVLKGRRTSTALYRDTSAWYHIVVAYDTTQSTASDRIKIYVNGEVVSDFSATTDPALNHDGIVNNTIEHRHFSIGYGAYWLFDGYLAEVNFIDGTALTPASFGETNADTNQWQAIKYTGSYGTNGFYLPFSDRALANSFTDSSSSSKTITANGDVVHSRAQAKIGSSSIKFDGTGDYLTTPNSADWNFGTGDFTFEGWFYTDSATDQMLFSQYEDSSNRWYLRLDNRSAQESLGFYHASSGIDVEGASNTWPGANQWVHMAFVRSSGTISIYINGSAITLATSTNPGSSFVNESATLRIGDYNGGSNYSGYMDEIRISNSARYTGAFTPTTTAFASDANTKLLIHSDFNGGLASDSSGNQNDFIPKNITVSDQVLDSPTNNFATLNSVFVSPAGPGRESTLSEGNLKATTPTSGSGYNGPAMGTIGMASGKWYFEWYIGSANWPTVGIAKSDFTASFSGNGTGNRTYGDDGNLYGASSSSSSTTYTTGDIIGCAVDMDNGKMWFSKNGTFIDSGNPAGGTNAQFTDLLSSSDMGSTGQVLPFFSDVNWSTSDTVTFNAGQDSSFAGAKTAQGNGGVGEDFYYAPPTGFKALNTDNLDDPSIALPGDYFNTVLYTGNGSTQSITGVGFQPDLLWLKSRSTAFNNLVHDSVRGKSGDKYLYLEPSTTIAEAVQPDDDGVWSLDSDGFSLDYSNSGAWNNSGTTYVAWNWKAGGTASSNSDGTITSSVSANTTAGFSIATFTGNQTSGATVGHGLSQAPEMIIVKGTTFADSWGVYHFPGMGNTHGLLLNSNVAEIDSVTYWNDTTASASVFSLGDDTMINKTGQTMLAYCFHSVEGYSKVGSYVGNDQNPNGPFIYMGFKPNFLMIKAVDRSDDWIIVDNKRDSYNIVTRKLNPNTSGAEITNHAIVDFVSNGFKVKDNSDKVNLLGSNYLYLAFAESPFKTSNAR